MWSYNRLLDSDKITKENINWQGPLSMPGYENTNGLNSIPDLEGVYLITFKFNDGYLLYGAGITNSTKRRLKEHIREYKKGNYTILDMKSAKKGIRNEIWHGWDYAKTHRKEFLDKKETILKSVDQQLSSSRIFITELKDKRLRERIEASIMNNIYNSKENWADLADRGMFLKMRYNSEMPIEANNIADNKIYGLPDFLDF